MASTREGRQQTVDIHLWPGLAVCSALQLALSSDELPGIGEDFAALPSQISPSLAEDIAAFQLTYMPSALADMSFDPSIRSLPPESFFAWVESLPAPDLALHARAYVENHEENSEAHALKAKLVDSPEAWMMADAAATQLDRARCLLESPAELQAMVTRTLRQFWAAGFREIYQSRLPAMEQVVDALRSCPDLNDLPKLFTNLLGRSIHEIAPMLDTYPGVSLVPFPFMGPYVLSMTTKASLSLLLLGFDGQQAWETLTKAESGLEVSKLKALADETRLKILAFVSSANERFGGDIVTHLGISQPGVSRHLRLLTASGLLRVRQEGTSKYYSIGDDVLAALVAGIQELKSNAPAEEKGETT